MAFTYTPQNAIDFVKKYIKDVPITDIDSTTCDTVSSIMYIEGFWRWTIQNIPPGSIPLVNGIQDYDVPTNLYRMWRARIVRTDVTPEQYCEIGVREFIPPELNPCGPFATQAMCHEESLGVLRLSQAVQISGSETYELQGEYQINPVKITDSNLTDTFWFPDQYFPVFCEGLKWKWFDYTDDSRAGSITIAKDGRRSTTGQAAKFWAALDAMKMAEDYGAGDANEFPDSPLGSGAMTGVHWVYGG